MGLSTNLISGLASGFDWRTMIDEIMKIEHRSVDLVEARKREYEEKLTEWQSINTELLSLKKAAGDLKHREDLSVFSSAMTTGRSTVEASRDQTDIVRSALNPKCIIVTCHELRFCHDSGMLNIGMIWPK